MKVSVFWFRRDLRLFDNAGLHAALRGDLPVVPLFIFDTDILNELPDKKDKRVEFIHNALKNMQHDLEAWGSSLIIRHGKPRAVWEKLLEEFDVAEVFTNSDYEPYASRRDEAIRSLLNARGITLHSFRDQVIFDKEDVLKANGEPYTVFTPYKNAWKKKFAEENVLSVDFPVEPYRNNFYAVAPQPLPTLNVLGFESTNSIFPNIDVPDDIIQKYHRQRDIPGVDGTSRLGVHLRFGTVSVRDVVKRAFHANEVWLDELIWREFFKMILYFFPHVETKSFRDKYDRIEWRKDKNDFEKWSIGQTGYPLVDAGMRELNETGFMHNRVRMVTASFLCKHLLIDWRWGERYFAEKLLDYDLSANNGNWQWAAGTGCDAAPYFRVFNPTTQMEKFDPDLKYVKKWVPEWGTPDYPEPIVEHRFARQRAIETYAKAVKGEH